MTPAIHLPAMANESAWLAGVEYLSAYGAALGAER